MKYYHIFYLFIVLSLGFTSCKKEKITTYENVVVGGNTPPPYSGVPETKIEIYVGKLYIDLLGEEATQAEISSGVAFLKSKELRMGARDTLIDQLIVNDKYFTRLYIKAKGKFLEGVNEFQINQEILTQDYIITLLYARGDTFSAQIVEVSKEKLVRLKKADSLFKNNSISVNQFYAIFSDNSFYDDINMGSRNFVLSCFENYFLREATVSERTNGVDMVDGQSKIILLKNGNSKDDFIRIITESHEFYEGLVKDNFKNFLSRDPSSLESYQATLDFKSSNNIKEMQKSILKTDEYAGF